MQAHMLIILVLSFTFSSCKNTEDEDRQSPLKEYFFPVMDNIKFNTITPPSTFLRYVTCQKTRWTNLEQADTVKGKNVQLAYMEIYFGNSKDSLFATTEEILFVKLKPREELKIEYDVPGKKYSVIYFNHQFDGEFESHRLQGIHSIDSILKNWNQKPFYQWGATENQKYQTSVSGCMYTPGSQRKYLLEHQVQ